MRKRNLFLSGGVAALGLVLIALPGTSAAPQDSADAKLAQMQQRIDELQARLAERLAGEQQRIAELAQDREAQSAMRTAFREAREQEQGQQQEMEKTPRADGPDTMIFMGDEGASWLGVESQEVTSDKVKELKLPAERGVLLGRIVPDSPAAKAGLQDNDVITEINGQRVEGEAQFRRMIHEIPSGRTAQFTIWRNGRAQPISVTLGKSEERGNMWFKTAPRAFSFQLPRVEIPEMPDVPEAPGMEWNYGVLAGARPRLGIDAEDLNGQLGAYFGAPDGEGVLVRDVSAGSSAEKAGVKSGDVITSVDGDRIRSLGDLREKLADKREAKTIKLGVLRNKNEMSLTVEMPPLPSRTKRTISRRTNI
ncbi:MAG TPA: PDZ domain-containing protein [Candidatus Solibacter sp.]|nr:PDZ domain-containing protein [Candidatus Solibacter sp.]